MRGRTQPLLSTDLGSSRTAPQSLRPAHANLVAVLPVDWASQGDQKLALKFGLSASLQLGFYSFFIR